MKKLLLPVLAVLIAAAGPAQTRNDSPGSVTIKMQRFHRNR